jgi:hypothetical protein
MNELPEIDAFDHTGRRLPTPATALAVWKRVRQPMKLDTLEDITRAEHGLQQSVKDRLKVTAAQALTVALDCAVQSGRAGRLLTVNRFVESLAARWSKIYKATQKKCKSDSLNDFTKVTVIAIRKELDKKAGIALPAIWVAVAYGVRGLYRTSWAARKRGRRVRVAEKNPLLVKFDALLDADRRYRRDRARGRRILFARDPMPPRKIDQRVAGERPYDVMGIGEETKKILGLLEGSTIYLDPGEVHDDIQRAKAELAASTWPEHLGIWKRIQVIINECLIVPKQLTKDERKTVARETRALHTAYRDAILDVRKKIWADFLELKDRQLIRARHNSVVGRLRSMEAIYEQLKKRKLLGDYVPLKSAYYKHPTRRFQARNVWPSEQSTSRELLDVLSVPRHAVVDGKVARIADTAFVATTPQRIRWYKVRRAAPSLAINDPEVSSWDYDNLTGLDVSGSQAQILAVIMGLRDVERDLREAPFKKLVVLSARALQERGELRIPDGMSNPELEESGKTSMLRLYGAEYKNIARGMKREPWLYGPGFDAEALETWFTKTSVVDALTGWLDVCRAVAANACEKSPTAGVEVEDILDGARFVWNPPKRRKVQVSSAINLYVKAPKLDAKGEMIVDAAKLTRRVAPGLVHMADAAYAAVVIRSLHAAGIKDFVSVHDAFLVPDTAPCRAALRAIVGEIDEKTRQVIEPGTAGAAWLPMLERIYDVLERYIPEDREHGPLVRSWRKQWHERCEAQDWPTFRVKPEEATITTSPIRK